MPPTFDIETFTKLMHDIFDKKMDDLGISFRAMDTKFDALVKEVSESRQALLLRQEALDGKINSYELGAVQARIDANAAGKVAEKVSEETDQKIHDCKEDEPARVGAVVAATPPKMSWLQIAANLVTVVGVAAALFVVISFSLSTFKATIDRLEIIVTRLEQNLIAHISQGNPGGNH